jgi:uncharacterized protein (TIGR03118 family)
MRISTARSAAASAALSVGLLAGLAASPAHATRFQVTNLVSDGSVPAATTDPNLINPWGVSYGPGGPFWISDNGTGVSTLYSGAGGKVPLTVTIAPPTGQPGPAAPTGQVFNGNSSNFIVTNGSKSGSAVFIFDTEDGAISGWAPSVDATHSILAVDNSAVGQGAVYKGLTMGAIGSQEYLYATDFRDGLVEQFNSSFGLVRAFTDPTVAAGYAPFNALVDGNHLFVTYALQDSAKHDDVAGPGHGYVDEFSLDGTFIKRLASGGPLNSPWGLDIAPSDFGAYAGDLLVGNFGDGTISAFNANTGVFAGKLLGTDGQPIVLGDLWALINGGGGKGGDPGKVYFTAGVADEAEGLFGSLTPVPEPSVWAMMLTGFAALGVSLRARRRRAATA